MKSLKIILFSFLYVILFINEIKKVSSYDSSSTNIACENVNTDETSDKIYLDRKKRHLIFPNATLFQVNFGVGVPVPLKFKKININLIFQANFVMPWNITQLPAEVLFGPLTSTARRKRATSDEQREPEDIEKMDITDSLTEDKSNLLMMRNFEEYDNYLRIMDIYKVLEEHFESYGHNGSDCLLRTLCQLGSEPLHTEYEDDVLHDIMRLLMRPSDAMHTEPLESSRSGTEDPVLRRYIEAQMSGEENQNCNALYPFCLLSPADLFTRTFNENKATT